MSFMLDSYFKVNQSILDILTLEANRIASNVANVNTPNYKKIKINFLDEFKKNLQNVKNKKNRKKNFNNSDIYQNIWIESNSKLEQFSHLEKAFNSYLKNEKLNDKLKSIIPNKKNLSSKNNSIFSLLKNSLIHFDMFNDSCLKQSTNSTLKNIMDIDKVSKNVESGTKKKERVSVNLNNRQ